MASTRASSWVAWGVLVAGSLGVSGLAGTARADGMRCQNRLVQSGATKYDVQALCGAPDATEQRSEKRAVRRQVNMRCADGISWCTGYIEDTVEVPVEEWTYDFGTQRFLQYLTFENGKLLRVRSGGYGHKQL